MIFPSTGKSKQYNIYTSPRARHKNVLIGEYRDLGFGTIFRSGQGDWVHNIAACIALKGRSTSDHSYEKHRSGILTYPIARERWSDSLFSKGGGKGARIDRRMTKVV
jgi:hypothetical protein